MKFTKQRLEEMIKYPDTIDPSHKCHVIALANQLYELMSAASIVVKDALDDIEVHSCDMNNNEIKSKQLPEELKKLYDLLNIL